MSPAFQAEYAALLAAITPVLSRATPENEADRVALRLVILHHWRRLCLRNGALPDLVMPADWVGGKTRAAVLQALARFERPDPEAMAQ